MWHIACSMRRVVVGSSQDVCVHTDAGSLPEVCPTLPEQAILQPAPTPHHSTTSCLKTRCLQMGSKQSKAHQVCVHISLPLDFIQSCTQGGQTNSNTPLYLHTRTGTHPADRVTGVAQFLLPRCNCMHAHWQACRPPQCPAWRSMQNGCAQPTSRAPLTVIFATTLASGSRQAALRSKNWP